MLSRLKGKVRSLATRNEIPVLNYHGVISGSFPFSLPYHVPETQFREHIRYLASNFECLSVSELCAALHDGDRVASNAVAITFDDGFANNLHRAVPILEEFGVRATVFVVSGFLDSTALFWAERAAIALADAGRKRVKVGNCDFDLSTSESRTAAYLAVTRHVKVQAPRDANAIVDEFISLNGLQEPGAGSPFSEEFRFLRRVELERLAEHELVTVGSHTVSHHRLKNLPAALARSEIAESKQTLEAVVDDVEYFAYPFGGFEQDFDETHVAMVRSCGYSAAFAVGTRGAAPGDDAFITPRINVTSGVNVESLNYLATGGASISGDASAASVIRGIVAGMISKEYGK